MSEAPVISVIDLQAKRLKGETDAWPSLIDITTAHEKVPPFPTELLPEPFSTFVEDVADRLQVPGDFVAIPVLVSAATMLGTEFRLAPKRHDDWSERACLWGVVISLPSTLKTPAGEEGTRAPRKIHNENWEIYKVAKDAWKRDKGDPADEPVFERLITNDTTVEKLSSMMMENPRGMMLYRDELSGWFNSLNKYRARGVGDDRQFYIQCYSGNGHSVDRLGRDPVYVPNLYLSIFGTIQPEVARAAFAGGDDDGMMSRFGLMAYPDLPGEVAVVDRLPDFDARRAVEQRLREMREAVASEPLRFDGLAYALFNRWLLRNVNRREGAFDRHLNKYQGLFARLALVLHFMRRGARAAGEEVSIETATAVRTLIDDYLEPHARKVYGAMAVHPARAGAVKIAEWLRKEKVDKITARDVRRRGWAEFAKDNDDRAIQASMDLVEAYGWVRLEESNVRIGRPTQRWVVNPATYEGD